MAVEVQAQNLGSQQTSLYGPWVDFDLNNSSWSGNPFDVEATATFTHMPTGQTLTHRMFYAGPNTNQWTLRFTGTKAGEWTFQTNSADSDLNGRTGTINVAAAPDARGFTVGVGNQWAQQRGSGALVPVAPQLAMYARYASTFTDTKIDTDINTFLDGHGFTGFHVPSVGGQWFDYDKSNDIVVDTTMTDPDPRTFEALERLITKTHAAGGHTHIWAWGDTDRKQTPDTLSGGKNGAVDQRLQKYIASRLGPLPGWSMGYGFDLNEWAGASHDPSFVNDWEERILANSGYEILLGGRSDGPNSSQPFSRDVEWNSNFGYAGYEHHKPSYEDYLAAVEASINGQPISKPVMSEDRFRIRNQGRSKDYDEDQTRRGMWHSMMAGGVSNIWGNLLPFNSDDDQGTGSYSSETKTELQTWNTFWFGQERFRLGMVADNSLSPTATSKGQVDGLNEVGTVVFRDGDDLIIFYAENTDSIDIDLTSLSGDYDAIAVDALGAYQEIDLGVVSGEQTLNLGSTSDWAVALTPVPEPGMLSLTGAALLPLVMRRGRGQSADR